MWGHGEGLLEVEGHQDEGGCAGGAAPGVAVLSAVANSAGSLASAAGVVDGFPRGFLAAAGIAAVLAVFAYLRMPAARVEGGAGMHMHH